MPQVQSPHFGAIDYTNSAVLEFPEGIPAFESEKQFLVVERAETAPVVFLQSVASPGLAFMTLPASLVEPGYRLELAAEDLESLELDAARQPEEGREVLTLAIVTVDGDRSATVNLMAPVVINLKTRRALQAVQPGSGYSARHPLPARGGQE
jgi:flagellar assembly factor FliW